MSRQWRNRPLIVVRAVNVLFNAIQQGGNIEAGHQAKWLAR